MSTTADLTLVVPGLLGPWPGAMAAGCTTRLPVLERWLARGRLAAGPRLPDDWLGEPGAAPTLASLCHLADLGDPAATAVLCAEPVHLRADRDRLLLFGPETLAIEPEEAEALVEAFNRHFEPQDLSLEAARPARWYLHHRETRGPGLPPLTVVLGREPPVAGDSSWRALLNEIQMLFFAHPVNAARLAAGRPAISGLWPWGGEGLQPGEAASRLDGLWSDEPLWIGWARHAGIGRHDLPADAPEWLARSGGGRQLVWLGQAEAAWAYGRFEDWLEVLEMLEWDWFMPLQAALMRGRLRELRLLDGRGRQLLLRRGDALRLWRRSRPLAQWLGGET